MNNAAWSLVTAVALVGSAQCPVSDCPPEDGLLTAGEWGGEHWRFEVASDGVVYVETDCAHGTSNAPVSSEEGAVAFAADMVSIAGEVQYPEEDPVPFVATFSGTLCGDTLTFTETVVGTPEDPGAVVTTEGVVVYGEPAALWTCQ